MLRLTNVEVIYDNVILVVKGLSLEAAVQQLVELLIRYRCHGPPA